ncbi:pentatricopeptide repeat-containing protein At4g33990 [Ricinus communis]|uniref:pentatricopeptide repeat-containing protein At4g33990 n=1 Tax=Ricinus communis TaxID=3988 RepID=UPI000772C76D|nr:pentatricopeptide repeat-containing protein At4g33990 [Ricinus communis]|eukprot:XP_015583544.1 pentatricopeptide repeat-containing protein At4g33990 [Ricinus communis]
MHGLLHFFTTTKHHPLLLHSHYLKTHHLSSLFSLLHSCKDLRTLKQIHASLLVSTGFNESISFPSTKLISFYSKFNDLESAISVFSLLQEPNTLSWNLIMRTHLDFGLVTEALLLYKKMRESGVKTDAFTFPTINRAVMSLKSDVLLGKMVHCDAMKLGFGYDLYFCNTMIEVYARCGCVYYGRVMFDEMSPRDLVSWTSMISGYVSEGNVFSAFELFNKMRLEMEPNSVTLIVMLKGCYAYDNFSEGRQLHCYIIKNGLLIYGSVQNSILRMYSITGSAKEVESLFVEIYRRDVISWNTLIGFYALRGDAEEMVCGFNQMRGEVALSSETLTLVISVFAKIGNLVEGEKLHSFSIKVGLCDDVLLASLLDFYAKCGELRNSVQLFGEIPCRSSSTWKLMMSGCIQNGYFDEAIHLFRQMQASGVQLQAQILGSLVDACSHLGSLQLCKEIHGYLTRNFFYILEGDNIHLGTSILNMYIRCGSISSAREYFNRMVAKDNITWTSMIEGYGIHGMAIEALKLFNQMLVERVLPNRVTFLSLLSACSHSGLIRQGCELFLSMKWVFGMEPDLDHYTCMVDLLGRCGKIKEALAMIIRMVVVADSRIWGALVASCRVHGDKKVGEFAAQRLLEMESDNVGYYTLLSNIQAMVGKWDEVEQVRKVIHEKDLRKTPGWSCIVGKGRNYCFISGDRTHKQAEEIYDVLRHLSTKVQEFGHY